MSVLRLLRGNRRLRAGSLALFLLAGAGGISCGGGDGPAPPQAGDVLLRLDGATAADEAVLLTIAAGATAVHPAGGVQVHARVAGGIHTVAAFGSLAGGPILRMTVADVSRPPAVTIREVAASDGSLRSTLSTYRIRVERVP